MRDEKIFFKYILENKKCGTKFSVNLTKREKNTGRNL